jgi:hypothetical protein
LKKLREEFEAQREKIDEDLKSQDFERMWEDPELRREKRREKLFKKIPSFSDIYYNFFRKFPLEETIEDPCMQLT